MSNFQIQLRSGVAVHTFKIESNLVLPLTNSSGIKLLNYAISLSLYSGTVYLLLSEQFKRIIPAVV